MLQALKAQPRAAQVCFFCVWLDLLGPIPCNDARLGTNCIVERDFISRNRIDDMPPKCEQDNRQFGWKGQLRRLYNFAQLKVGVALEQEPTYSCVVGSCIRSTKKQDQNHNYQSVNRLIFFWTSSLVTSLPTSPQVLKISFQELRYVGLHVEWHDEFHPECFSSNPEGLSFIQVFLQGGPIPAILSRLINSTYRGPQITPFITGDPGPTVGCQVWLDVCRTLDELGELDQCLELGTWSQIPRFEMWVVPPAARNILPKTYQTSWNLD